MIKKIKRLLLLVTFIILFILYYVNSTYIIQNILDYSQLFLTKLFPASFIFFLLSNMILEYQLLDLLSHYFMMNGTSTYLFLASMLSGFPSGAKYTKELYQRGYFHNKEYANKGLYYSHFPNPLFITSSVQGILHDYSLSITIYLSLVISNFILFLLYKDRGLKEKRKIIENKSFSIILKSSIEKTFQTLLLIYGTSLFFFLIASILTKYLSFSSYPYILVNGLFDLTKGIFSTTILSSNGIKAFFILFFLSFGSISIHIQVSAILEEIDLSYWDFLKGRILGTLLSIGLFFLINIILM